MAQVKMLKNAGTVQYSADTMRETFENAYNNAKDDATKQALQDTYNYMNADLARRGYNRVDSSYYDLAQRYLNSIANGTAYSGTPYDSRTSFKQAWQNDLLGLNVATGNLAAEQIYHIDQYRDKQNDQTQSAYTQDDKYQRYNWAPVQNISAALLGINSSTPGNEMLIKTQQWVKDNYENNYNLLKDPNYKVYGGPENKDAFIKAYENIINADYSNISPDQWTSKITELSGWLTNIGHTVGDTFAPFTNTASTSQSSSSEQYNNLISQGYSPVSSDFTTGNVDLDDLIKQEKYKVLSKDNKNYIYKEDYSGVAPSRYFLQSDYQNALSRVGSGFYINPDGTYFTSENMANETNYAEQYNAAKAANENKYWWVPLINFNPYSTFDDTGDYTRILSGITQAQKSEKYNTGTVIDVSPYFQGDDPMYVFLRNGEKPEDYITPEGEFDFNKFNSRQAGFVYNAKENKTYHTVDGYETKFADLSYNINTNEELKKLFPDHSRAKIIFDAGDYLENESKPDVNEIINLITNPTNNPDKYYQLVNSQDLNKILKYVLNNIPNGISDGQKNALKSFIKKYVKEPSQQTESHKVGGVLKFLGGGEQPIYSSQQTSNWEKYDQKAMESYQNKQQEYAERAKKAGITIEELKDEDNRVPWGNKYDIIRLGTTLNDLVSIFTPSVASGIQSGVSGLTRFFTNLADPLVSSDSAFKELKMDALTTGLSFAPVIGKAKKVVQLTKSMSKLAKNLLNAASWVVSAGLIGTQATLAGPEVMQLLKDMQDDNFWKNPENITRVIQNATNIIGLGKSVGSVITSKVRGGKYFTTPKTKVKVTSKSGKSIELFGEDIDDFYKAMDDYDGNKMKEILKKNNTSGLTDTDISDFLKGFGNKKRPVNIDVDKQDVYNWEELNKLGEYKQKVVAKDLGISPEDIAANKPQKIDLNVSGNNSISPTSSNLHYNLETEIPEIIKTANNSENAKSIAGAVKANLTHPIEFGKQHYRADVKTVHVFDNDPKLMMHDRSEFIEDLLNSGYKRINPEDLIPDKSQITQIKQRLNLPDDVALEILIHPRTGKLIIHKKGSKINYKKLRNYEI